VAQALGTLSELRAALDRGRTSARELVDAALARAEAVEPRLHALLGTRPEAARAEAEASDARRARGEHRSLLDGIPVALKDNLSLTGEPVGCASRILEGYRALYDATAVARLREAGAVVVARTNMDEFAMGSSTENSAAGPTANPWDPRRSPGGSSGGSAAAVAAGIVPLAFGSDTGGSIRQPAALCGVTGLKPTYGRVSRYGLVAFASSLDQIGPLARSAADCAAALDVVAGHDPCDATSLPEPAPRCHEALSGDVSDLVIGLPREMFELEGAHPEVLARVREGVEELERAGAKLREVSLPHMRYGIAAYYLIATAEASSNLARFDGVRYGRRVGGEGGLRDMYLRTRSEGFGPEVKRRILLGTFVLSAGYYDAYYRKAQQVRTLLRRDFEAAFAHCDLLAGPTAPEPAFPLGERAEDPLRMYLSDVYTVGANLAGLPGVSVPCGRAEGLPVGLQLLGRPLEDATVLRAADAFQRRTAHHETRPPEAT
jgi:aspartyl-tRNA(Asn)/glutamyl-tRNA(Gln) amidotransferase subunit A